MARPWRGSRAQASPQSSGSVAGSTHEPPRPASTGFFLPCCFLGVVRSTVPDNLKRAEAAGLRWPLPAEITDPVLEQRLFALAGVRPGLRRRVEPDWAWLARELKRPGVTLMVLWEEYRDAYPAFNYPH